MKCLSKNVILAVEVIDGNAESPGGILLPEKAKEEDTYEFTVVAVGPGVTEDISVGDKVLEPEVTIVRHNKQRHGGSQFDLQLPDGRDAMVVMEDDIRIVFEDEDEPDTVEEMGV